MLFMSENTLHRVIQCLFDQMHHELLHYTLNIHVHDTYSQSRNPMSTTITSRFLTWNISGSVSQH
jgi:hypothetical protein